MSQHLLATNAIAEKHANAVRNYFDDIFVNLPRNTQRAYIGDFNEFLIYCEQQGVSGFTSSLDANEQLIKSYVRDLCESPLAYKTIRRRLSALSKFLGIAKLPNPLRDSTYLKDFIKLQLASNEKFELGNQSLPLTIELVEQINETIIPETLLEMRDIAMANLMFDALLRADEVIRVTVERINRRENTILVPSSKADQTGKGSYRFISNTTIGMIDEYIAEANRLPCGGTREKSDPKRINRGIIFRAISPKGTALLPHDESKSGKAATVLNYSSVYRIFERLTIKAGLPYKITPHSGRIGGAISLAESGASDRDIQNAGGWHDPSMPAHYTRQARVKKTGMGNLAKTHSR